MLDVATASDKEGNSERIELALQVRLRAGEFVEHLDDMTPRYRDVLLQTIMIAADLEIMTLPAYYGALVNAPSFNDRIAVASAIQDEMGHAQVMYSLLEDFGIDTHEHLFVRDPQKFRSFQLIEQDIDDYIKCVTMMMLGDRAGRVTTMDLEEHCSYGPYARSLRKVNFEERFHVLHGEHWVKHFWNHSAETRKRVQDAVDAYFPMAAAWFGVPDHMKKRTDQILYRIRGLSNDELRQKWLAEVVPFCTSVGIKVPAHFDVDKSSYVLDYQEPILFDYETGKWDFTQVTWDEKFRQWKKGGPIKQPGLQRLQNESWGDALW